MTDELRILTGDDGITASSAAAPSQAIAPTGAPKRKAPARKSTGAQPMHPMTATLRHRCTMALLPHIPPRQGSRLPDEVLA